MRSGKINCSIFAFLMLVGACLTVVTLFVAQPVAAQQNDAAQTQIVSYLSNRYSGLNSLQASYTRVAKMPSTDKIFQSGASQTAGGTISWTRPDKLLIDQKSPQPEVMVTDGKTVWWHIPAEKLVYRYRNIDVADQLRPLLAFLAGIDSLNSTYNVSQDKPDASRAGQYGLMLTPKGSSSGVDRLTVWCDSTFALTGFRLISVTGETTDFYLDNVKENPKLNSRMFSFKIPRGTEVVDEE